MQLILFFDAIIVNLRKKGTKLVISTTFQDKATLINDLIYWLIKVMCLLVKQETSTKIKPSPDEYHRKSN